MAEEKWTYKLDAPDENGIVHGFTCVLPDGRVGTRVTLNDGAASLEEVEFRAMQEVARLNDEPLPRKARPEAVVRGKRC